MGKMSLLVREFKCKVLSSVVDPKHFNFGSRSYLSIWFGSNFRLDLDPVPNKKIYSILVQVLNFNKLKLTPTERFSTFQFCFIKFHNFLCMKLLHFNVNLPILLGFEEKRLDPDRHSGKFYGSLDPDPDQQDWFILLHRYCSHVSIGWSSRYRIWQT